MLLSNPWQSYKRVATETASPGQLVLMLFDGAIGFLERARTGFQCDDPLDFNLTINNNLLRAQAIIQELNSSLDMERGGEFAATMRRLYDYMDRRLHESNQFKREDGIIEVLRHLGQLREAWDEMLRKGRGEANPSLANISLSAVG